MTPDALRAAIASARERPRMYGDSPGDLETYLHGLVAGAYDGDCDVRGVWAALRDPPLRPGVHPDSTFDSVCDHALRVVAALWPQGEAAPALYLDAIEARETAALAAVRERLRTESLDAVGVVSLKVAEQRAEDAVRLVAEVRCLRAAERHSAGPDALDDATAREVLDATRAVVTEGLGLTAAPDVVAAQLPEYVGNLLARAKRLAGERDAAEAEARRLREPTQPAPALDLAAIEARRAAAVAAFPYPWWAHPQESGDVMVTDDPDAPRGYPTDSYVAECRHPAVAAFLISATVDIPELVAEVRRIRAQRVADLAEHAAERVRWGDRKVELLARVVELEASEEAMHADVAAAEELVGRQGALLVATANALKGPPPPRTQHSAHDLPEVAAALRAEVDALKARLAAAEPVLMLDALRSGRFVVAPCAGCGAAWPEEGAEACPACGRSLDGAEGETFAATHPYAAGAIMGGVAHRSEVE